MTVPCDSPLFPADLVQRLARGVAAPARRVLFGLPGNPVAVMVTFCALVRDALLAMSGATAQPLPMLRAASSAPLRKKPGRTEYRRGVVTGASMTAGKWRSPVRRAQAFCAA